MAYLVQFGSFVFPPGFAPMTQDSPRDIAEQERPRAAGAIVQVARHQSRRLSIEGAAMGFGGGQTAIQAAEDAIRGACESSGSVQTLYFGRSDRYINAQHVGVSEIYKQGDSSAYGVNHRLMLSFVAGDSYFYDAAGPVNAPGLTSGGGTVTPGGNASAFAAWTISVTTGAAGPIVLSNTATGEIAALGTALTVWGDGDQIVLTRQTGVYTVAKNGIAAPGLLLGLIPRLAASANALTLAASGGIVLGPLKCTYTARWQS